MKTKKGLIVWVLLLLAIGVRGQVLERQVIATTGGGTTAHSFTMGEVLISSQQLEVTVGFQQPAFLEAGEEPLGLQDITSQLNVYPTPTINELTINGDLFDLWYAKLIKIVKDKDNVLIRLINLLTKDIQIIYIVGNHDIHMLNFRYLKHPLWYFLKNVQRFPPFNKYVSLSLFNQLNGRQLKKLSIKENYKLKLGQRRFFVTHGHMFDLFTDRFKRLSVLLDKFNLILYFLNRLTLPIFNFKISVAAKKGMVSFAPAAKNIKKRCFKYIVDINKIRLPQTRFDGIIIGHLHWPEIIKQTGFTYYNSGDWIDSLSWLEIDFNGQVKLKKINQLLF